MTSRTVAAEAAEKSNTIAAWLPWLLGAAPVLLLFAHDLWMSNHGLVGHEVFWGRDFMNVWTGGTLIRNGHVAVLYDLHAYWQFARSLFGDIMPINYSYPPLSYPIAATFSLLPYWLALTLWLGGTGALFAWAARPWWPSHVAPWWLAVLTPAALVNIWAGHYGFLIGALFLLGWQNLDRRPLLAGVCFGLMLVKPHMAVLVPLALALRGEWRAIAAAAVTSSILVGVTCALYGPQPWLDFVLRTGPFQASLIDARDSFHGYMSPSIMTSAFTLGFGLPAALTLQAAWSAGAVALMVLASRHRAPTRDFALLVATCTFLLLPYAFNYDMTVVGIASLWVLSRQDLTQIESRGALFGFWAPTVGMVLSAMSLPVMPLMILGLALLQYRAIATDYPVRARMAPGKAQTA